MPLPSRRPIKGTYLATGKTEHQDVHRSLLIAPSLTSKPWSYGIRSWWDTTRSAVIHEHVEELEAPDQVAYTSFLVQSSMRRFNATRPRDGVCTGDAYHVSSSKSTNSDVADMRNKRIVGIISPISEKGSLVDCCLHCCRLVFK